MKPITPQSAPTNGLKLVVAAIVLAILPVLAELGSDGGPSGFGKPETGYVMVFFGFVMWPLALILALIGVKRLMFANTTEEWTPKSPVAPEHSVQITDAWADISRSQNLQSVENEEGKK